MTQLSTLQRYILRAALAVPRAAVDRRAFLGYYERQQKPISIDSLTKVLERLLDRGLVSGYGRRTPKKWFIERVRLTLVGRTQAKKLYGQQTKFNW